tara:strand:+ start:11990 stop:12514 length:525 start_codon:yes stop_codon:yes gene_type:complete
MSILDSNEKKLITSAANRLRMFVEDRTGGGDIWFRVDSTRRFVKRGLRGKYPGSVEALALGFALVELRFGLRSPHDSCERLLLCPAGNEGGSLRAGYPTLAEKAGVELFARVSGELHNSENWYHEEFKNIEPWDQDHEHNPMGMDHRSVVQLLAHLDTVKGIMDEAFKEVGGVL